MPKKNIGPKLEPSTIEWYQSTFQTTNAGASFILESFPALYRTTLARELKGRFTRGELMLMLDVCNGLYLLPSIAGQHIYLEAHDGIALNGLDKKWEVDKDSILGKLNGLTYCQRAILEIWCRSFWEMQIEDIESYVAMLTE